MSYVVVSELFFSTTDLMTKSMARPNNMHGDQISPCLTSVMMLNQLEREPSHLTEQVVYMLIGVSYYVDDLCGHSIDLKDVPQ